jgi:hypothetical protein
MEAWGEKIHRMYSVPSLFLSLSSCLDEWHSWAKNKITKQKSNLDLSFLERELKKLKRSHNGAFTILPGQVVCDLQQKSGDPT